MDTQLRTETSTVSMPSGEMRQPSDHLETLEGLKIASEVLGERARGPVSLGIRARAVSRMVTASAVRQLVHLQGKSQPEEDDDSYSSECAGASPSRSLSRGKTFEEFSCRDETDSLAAMLSSAAKSCKLSSRIQKARLKEVLANTTLGKMVQDDPNRAARFGLTVVPSWWQNKPWPPPPVVCHFSSKPSQWAMALRAKNEERRRKEEEARQRILERRQSRQFSKGKTELEERRAQQAELLSGLGSAVHRGSQSVPTGPAARKGQAAHMRRQSRTPADAAEEHLQDVMEHATKLALMNQQTKEQFLLCFEKHSETTPGYLNSQALLKALAEVGLRPTTFREKQQIKEVQQMVIHSYRTEESLEAQGVKNPLTEKRGGWLYEEFFAMAATCQELVRDEQIEADQALANQNECELAVVGDLRQVYEESRSQETLILKDFLAILTKIGIPHPPDKELAALLSLPPGSELGRFRKITFARGPTPDGRWQCA
ncbi:unnamed protein product [Effrenium voratum]|nr:unnamed protein product [Effrenium voratum]